METEQGKQVLVAKCAFSEQRNDSYVLASVVTGTLPRAEQRSRQKQRNAAVPAAAAVATPAFMNEVPFTLMGELWFGKWTWQQTKHRRDYDLMCIN